MSFLTDIADTARNAAPRGWATFALGIAFAVLFPIFLIAGNVGFITFSRWLYSYNWWRNGISDRTGLPVEQLDSAADQIKDYFRNDVESLQVVVEARGEQVGIFVEREILHMIDVKAIMQLIDAGTLWTGAVLLLVVLGCWVLNRRQIWHYLRSWLRWTALAWGVAVLIILVASLINFGWVFTLFHQLSFANDLWLLDPYRHWLLLLFPQRFFFEATLILAALAIVQYGLAYAAVAITARRSPVVNLEDDAESIQAVSNPAGVD